MYSKIVEARLTISPEENTQDVEDCCLKVGGPETIEGIRGEGSGEGRE